MDFIAIIVAVATIGAVGLIVYKSRRNQPGASNGPATRNPRQPNDREF
jgi:hypothetical protein